ncbi:PP2C family serine/threonine-protein phosphatase [Streptomyces calvus]|uniref:Serine/threonine protein phosphatase PrpC n=2 Tax=Streptomyces TaxID=1883 RepID=A0AA40SCB9_9ACTN|nr:PP2C family serine/threonine-protein phosphatase [Streptomyces calvus]MBA8943871.1 serine/threonine protein phosphatase PrpC [Streptomyces calvus]MBA8978309.1 serine/threonine protein phosphatase PrpC [Streptomyces calvus]
MSQMPQQAALSKCPSCEEPLESGDRFCGACGYDLSVVPARPAGEPTIAMNGSVPSQAAADRAHPRPPSAPPAWPAPSGAGAPAAPPAAGAPVPPVPGAAPPPPPPTAPPAVPSPGVRFDRRPEHRPDAPTPPTHAPEPSPAPAPAPAPSASVTQPDEYPLQAPDPRVAAEPVRAAGAAAVCVACRAGRVDDDGYCENCGHAQPRERDHMEQESGPIAAVSDRGLRHHRNEDAFAVGTTALPDGSPASVAVVCDGVSSATRPDEASLAASRAANESLLAALPRGTHPQQAMHDAIVAAADAVNALADEPGADREHAPQQNAPACTIVGTVVTEGLLVVGWVGDSRAYWIPVDRSTPPARLTEDDSWAAQMVAAGLMGEAEAYADRRAHAITGWLGADAYDLEPHTASYKPDRAGVVVVCTDGLWNYAESAEEMAGVVPADAAVRPLHGARVLVGHALDGGGHDNVTVALVPFPAVP